MKACSKCKKTLPKSIFRVNSINSNTGAKYLNGKCPPCQKVYNIESSRTREGVIKVMYGGQKGSSKKRGHSKPDYTLADLMDWVVSQDNFEALYLNWVGSGYLRHEKPSCDRIDDYKPYTLDNLSLTTWRLNEQRGCTDRVRGINNKINTAVLQYTLSGELVTTHYSQAEAARVSGTLQPNIHKVLKGIRNTAGGFIWRYVDEPLTK